MIAGIYGGMGAGLLATVLSAFTAVLFFMGPVGRLWKSGQGDLLILAFFIITCMMLCYTAGIMTHRGLTRGKEAEAQMKPASEKEKAAVAIRESEDRFRTLADNISQLAWMADEKGWIFWYNKRWYDYTGTSLPEMEGWGWKKVHHPDHVDRVVARIQVSWDSGEPSEDHFPMRGKDGRYRWFLSRALPIRDESGKVVRWFGTNTDITEELRPKMLCARARKQFGLRWMRQTWEHGIGHP